MGGHLLLYPIGKKKNKTIENDYNNIISREAEPNWTVQKN